MSTHTGENIRAPFIPPFLEPSLRNHFSAYLSNLSSTRLKTGRHGEEGVSLQAVQCPFRVSEASSLVHAKPESSQVRGHHPGQGRLAHLTPLEPWPTSCHVWFWLCGWGPAGLLLDSHLPPSTRRVFCSLSWVCPATGRDAKKWGALMPQGQLSTHEAGSSRASCFSPIMDGLIWEASVPGCPGGNGSCLPTGETQGPRWTFPPFLLLLGPRLVGGWTRWSVRFFPTLCY